MLVLDTHALLWWALDPERLSTTASELCARMEKEGGLASSISIWELGVKVARGKLDLGVPVEELARRLERSGVVELVPVDVEIWLHSLALSWSHRDPADRVIAATALRARLPLLTKDEAMAACPGLQCVW